MTSKKENSGGKKFQTRQPDEKRSRVTPKKASKPFKGKFDDKRSDSRPGFKKYGEDDRKPAFGKDKPGGYNRDKPGSFNRDKPADKRFKKDFGKDDKPFRKKEYGAEKGTPFRSDRGAAPSYKKRGGNDEKPFAPGGRGRNQTSGNFKPKEEFDKRRSSSKPFQKDKFSKTDRPASGGRKYTPKTDATPQNFKGRRKSYNKTADDLRTGKTLVEDEVRLNRYIANSGMCSRREADVLISQGLVTINGAVVETLGTKVNVGDDVRVDGKRINPEKPVYILLNKPKGYITSTSDPNERATVMDLIDLPGKERIYPVGRLDRNTTGVLLLTNDGELAQKLMHPSFEIKKIYKAGLDRKPSKDHMLAWVNGIELEDGFMSFEQIGFVDEDDDTLLGLEVHSGRNRIVRRMFEHFEYDVKSLDRVMLGEFDHVKLGRGKWRFLNEKEIFYVERLKRMKGKNKRA